jgi:hypothetical protein
MLTPTDVHFLVGLLTRISRPDGVEIELGSTVFDAAADEVRDVDVTVTSTDASGNVSAYEGIEVKHHKRPLDVAHVEQLCVKLVDMPSITSRSIVSASGFTSPSAKKAGHYGVALYELRKLVPPMELNGVIIQAKSMIMQESEREWVGSPNVSFSTSPSIPASLEALVGSDSKVANKEGLPIAGVDTLQQLSDRIVRKALNEAGNQLPDGQFSKDEDNKVRLHLTLTDEPQIMVGDDRFTIANATVDAVVRCRVHSNEAEFMVLTEYGSDIPIIGYAIAKLRTGNLFGVTIDNLRRVSSIAIPIADRLLKKIYRRRVP